MFGKVFPSGIFPGDTLLYADGLGPADRINKTAFTYTATTAGVLRHNAAGATWDGTITNVRIFNKILTVAQIGQIYNLEI